MRIALASTISILSFLHACFLAIPFVGLVQLWKGATGAPPYADQLVISLVSSQMIAADFCVAIMCFRVAFRNVDPSIGLLALPVTFYALLTITLAVFGAPATDGEFLESWLDAIWKFIWSGMLFAVIPTALRLMKKRAIAES